MVAKFVLCLMSEFSLFPLHGILETAGVMAFATPSTTLCQLSSCVTGDSKAPSNFPSECHC